MQHIGSTDWRSIFFAVAAIAMCGSFGCEDISTPDPERTTTGELWVSGRPRQYVVHLPPAYVESRPAPLFILFHGANDSGDGHRQRIGMDRPADAAGFITVYPDGIGQAWSSDDLPLVRSLIEHLRAQLAIDTTRIYASGFSEGGMFLHMVACTHADVLAAVAPVSTAMPIQTLETCAPARPLPVIMIHGTEDRAFPWRGAAGLLSPPVTAARWATFNGCSPGPTFRELPDQFDDGTRAWVETHVGCEDGTDVVFYGIEGGGHTWPGSPGPWSPSLGTLSQEIRGSEVVVDFLKDHRRH